MQPTFEQVMQLPVSHRATVPAKWGDMNGHMNMQHYLSVHEAAATAAFGALGFGQKYVYAEARSFFDLEHHLLYLREAMVEDELTAHIRLVERSDKVVHHFGYIVNQRTREVSNVLETISACVDLKTRRVTVLRPEEVDWIDAAIDHMSTLSWTPQPNDPISIRRS